MDTYERECQSTGMDIFDAEYFKISKLFLSLIGVWPYQTTSTRTLKTSLSAVGVIVMCMPMFLFVFKHSDDLDCILELMPTMAGAVTCGAKFVSLIYHFKKFKDLLQQVQDDWTNVSREAKEIFRRHMEITWKFSSIYTVSVTTFVIGFSLLPLANPLLDIVLPLNATRPKRFVHPVEMLVDHEKYYYTLLIIMYYGYIVSIAILVATDTIYFALIGHACALFDILSYHLENTVQDRSGREASHDFSLKQNSIVQHLIRCVLLHIKIKEFIKLIDSTFAIFLFFEIGLGFVLHCTICAMNVLRVNQVAEIIVYSALVVVQSGRLFFHGWLGQQITDHSIDVYISAYNGAWYKTSNTAKKMLLMLITRSQRISKIMVAKSFVMNLENFTVVWLLSIKESKLPALKITGTFLSPNNKSADVLKVSSVTFNLIMKTSLSYCMVILSMREE